ILLFGLSSIDCIAQNSKLQIRVQYEETPMLGAEVFVGDRQGTTDNRGELEITGLNSGTYTVKVTMNGFKSQEKKAVIKEDGNTTLFFPLEVEEIELQGVEVTGRKERGYKNTNTFTATKTETPIRYVPQSVSYVTKEVIQDQMAFKMMDVLKNISGVSQNSYTNN